VRVPKSVDEGDAVALEDVSRFCGRVPSDEQETAVREAPRLLYDAPGSGCIGVSLCLDRDGLGGPRELDDGIRPPSVASRLSLDRHTGDVTKDSGRLRIQVRRYLHDFTLLHSGSENSASVK
jgi:hypothetical protein